MKLTLRTVVTIVNAIASSFIFLFVYTAINKLLVLNTVSKVLSEYPLIGQFSEFIAWGLPLTEMIVAILLFIPKTRLIGLYGSLILIMLFTLYLGYMLTLTTQLPCTCGGMLEQLSWPQHLFFNLFCILLLIGGILLGRNKLKLISGFPKVQ